MVLVKILKRKDAASIVIAILVAMILLQPLNAMTARLATWISGLNNVQSGYGPGVGWKSEYLHPLVWAALELLVLEVACWIYIWLASSMKKK